MAFVVLCYEVVVVRQRLIVHTAPPIHTTTLIGENVAHVTCQKYVHTYDTCILLGGFLLCATAELCYGHHRLNSSDGYLLVSCWLAANYQTKFDRLKL